MFDSDKHDRNQPLLILVTSDVLTFHHILLNYLTELFHMGFGQILAVFGRFQPLVRARIALQFGRPWLRDLSVGHGEVEDQEDTELGREEVQTRRVTVFSQTRRSLRTWRDSHAADINAPERRLRLTLHLTFFRSHLLVSRYDHLLLFSIQLYANSLFITIYPCSRKNHSFCASSSDVLVAFFESTKCRNNLSCLAWIRSKSTSGGTHPPSLDRNI